MPKNIKIQQNVLVKKPKLDSEPLEKSKKSVDLTIDDDSLFNDLMKSIDIPVYQSASTSIASTSSKSTDFNFTVENFNKAIEEKCNHIYSQYQSWTMLMERLKVSESDKDAMEQKEKKLEEELTSIKTKKQKYIATITNLKQDMYKIYCNCNK
uniref:Uncharacterized protein LOC114347373 n=1 Tax=Diabrotica virgifera virgifera TaxID=50390 RepID=A0A6P7HDP0_DIAVI